MTTVLADTSVWVDHFRRPNAEFVEHLVQEQVRIHPLIIGEIACGTPPFRPKTLHDLALLRTTEQPSISEVLAFIEREQLFGLGCSLVDITLLASTLVTPGVKLWTLDKRLAALTKRFGVNHRPFPH